MEALFAFAAALLGLRLAGALASRYRARRAPYLAAWSAALLSYSIASAALAWGAAAGWDDRAFRVYYLFGGLLTAALLGVGSLTLAGQRWALTVGLVYTGLAVGVAVAVPLTEPVSGYSIPDAQEHLQFIPARLVAVLGNALILAGVAVAAAGSAVAGLGEAETAAFIAAAAVFLYAGFVQPSVKRPKTDSAQTG